MDFSKKFIELLNKYLNPYVENLSRQNFEKKIFASSPTIVFENLKIKREVLTLLGYEGLVVSDGEIQRLEFRIPWKVLFTGKIKVIVEGVSLQVEQDNRGSMVEKLGSEREREALTAALRKEKQDAVKAQIDYLKALKKAQDDGADATERVSSGAKIAQRVISNVDVEVTRTKLAFKSNSRGMWCCLRCEELAVYSTDQDFKRTDQVYPDGLIRKLLNIRDLSLELATATEPGGEIDEKTADHVLEPIGLVLQLKQEQEEPDNLRMLSVRILVSTEERSHIQLQRSDVKHLMQLQVDYSTEIQQLREIFVTPEQDEDILCNFDVKVREYCDYYRQYMEWEVKQFFDHTRSFGEPFKKPDGMQLLEDALPVRVIARQQFQLRQADKLGSASFGTFTFGSTFNSTFSSEQSSLSKGDSEELEKQFLAELEKLGPIEYPNNMSFTVELGKSHIAVIDDRCKDEHRDILCLQQDPTTVHVDYNTRGDDMTTAVCVRIGGFEITHATKTWISIRQPESENSQSAYKEAACVKFKAQMGLDYMELILHTSLEPIELCCANEALGSVLEAFTLPVQHSGRQANLYQQEEQKERLKELQEESLPQAAAAAIAEVMPDPTMSIAKRTLFFDIDIASPIIHVPVRDSGNLTMSLGSLRVQTPQKCGFNSIKVSVDLANTALHTRLDGHVFEIAPPVRRSSARTRELDKDGEEGIHLDVDCQLQEQETIVDLTMSFPGWTLKLVPEVAQILLAVPESLTAMLGSRELDAEDTATKTQQQPPKTSFSILRQHSGGFARDASAYSIGQPRQPIPYSIPSGMSLASQSLEDVSFVRRFGSAIASTSKGAEKVAKYQVHMEEVRQSKTTVNFAMSLDDDHVLVVTIGNGVHVPILKLAVDLPSPGVQVHYESGESGALDVEVEKSSLDLQILNSRNGEWEPLIEPTKFGIKLDQRQVSHRRDSLRRDSFQRHDTRSFATSSASRSPSSVDCVTKTHLSLTGHEPLLLNVTPTAINTLCFMAPLYQSYLSNSELHNPRTPKVGDCRILNLCEQQEFEIAFSSTASMSFTRQKQIQFVKPGCELLLPLWTDDMSHTTVTMEVRLAHQEPPASFSESASMGCSGATLVPGSPYTAQMFTDLDSHPTLLITSSICVHNQSALPVNVQFCASPGEADLAVHSPLAVCDAARLGHQPIYHLHPHKSITDHMVQRPEAECILLRPNELCSVPVTGIDFSDSRHPCTWMSIEACGSNRESSRFHMFNADTKSRMLRCHFKDGDKIKAAEAKAELRSDLASSKQQKGSSSCCVRLGSVSEPEKRSPALREATEEKNEQLDKKVAAPDEATEELCPAGHQLKKYMTPCQDYSCDRCHEVFCEGTEMHGCRQCNYDICSQCFMAAALEDAAEPSDDSHLFFLCEQLKPEELQGAGHQKPLTIAVRPPLVLTNSLPLGSVSVDYVARSSKGRRRVKLEHFDRLSLHDLEGPVGDEDIRMRICLGEQSGAEQHGAEKFSKQVILHASDFRCSALAPTQFQFPGEAKCISCEPTGANEVKFCCAGIFVDRSGLGPPLSLSVKLNNAMLPTLDGVALLPEAYQQASAHLHIRNNGTSCVSRSVSMPVVGWTAVPWRTAFRHYDFCFQVQNHTLKDVHRTACSVIEIRPRVVLSNLSDCDIELIHWEDWELRNRLNHGVPYCLKSGQSQELHRFSGDDADNGMDFRPANLKWAVDEGCNILNDDADPGSWPFVLPAGPGRDCSYEIWSVDRAPQHGALSVSFRRGSDFIAAHAAKTLKPLIIRTRNASMSETFGIFHDFEVGQDQEVQYGWENPFADWCVQVFIGVVGTEPLLTIDNVRLQMKTRVGGYIVQVLQRGKEMLLVLEDDQDGLETNEQTASLFQFDVKLRHVGVSIVQGAPLPQEMFYLGFNSVRFQMRTGGPDVEQYKFAISSAKIDCQLPAYIHGLKQSGFQRVDEKTSVIFTNIAEGELPFLAISVDRRAQSHDILLQLLDLSMGTLELTVDTAWVQPLLEWCTAIDTSRVIVPDSGVSISDKIRLAGKSITEDFIPPEVPPVMQIDQMKVSPISLHVWCDMDMTQMPFIPGWLRGGLRLVTAGNRRFILNGVSLQLEEYELPPVRGTVGDIAIDYCQEHLMEMLQVAIQAFAKGNLASTKIVDVGRRTATTGLQNFTERSSLLAYHLRTLSAAASGKEESWERKQKQRDKKITSLKEGAAEAGLSTIKGLGHVFDIVRKPIKGAAEEGVKGFVKGTISGAVGTVVKPIAGVFQAMGDMSAGIAAGTDINTEETRRHSQHQAQRLPRVMFGEFGALRTWSLLEALTLKQMGGIEPNGYSRLKGVAEIMPLVQVQRSCVVLLLFVSHLEMAFIDLSEHEIDEGRSAPPVRVTDQEESMQMFERAQSLRPCRTPGINVVCQFVVDASKPATFAELAQSEPRQTPDADSDRFELKITNGQDVHVFQHEAFTCPRGAFSGTSLQDRGTWYVLQAAMRSERTRLRKKLRQRSDDESVVKAKVFEVERWNGLTGEWQTPFTKKDEKHLGWRWVDERGFRHPHLPRDMSQEDCADSEKPPCDYKGLLTPAEGSEWLPDTNLDTEWKKTDDDGWVYASTMVSVVWEPTCTMSHTVRKRQWSRLYC